MSALTVTPTLLDVAKRYDSKLNIDKIVEMLSENNEIIQDLPVVECNDGTGHKTTVRTGLPTSTWRKLNYGIAQSKSTTQQIRDTCGMLESMAEVDVDLADMNGNAAAFRLSEDKAFIESMSQTMATTLFAGDTDINPERFLGLGPRYDDHTTAESKDNIILGGGSGQDNTSVYLVGWGENVHGLFPKGSKAGLSQNDLGKETKTLSDGSMLRVYRTHYKWDLGLCVRDWRFVVRICNIDKSDLTYNAGSGANLIDLMTQALEIVPTGSSARWAFYCNRTVKSFLRRQIVSKAVYQVTQETVAGKHVTMFDGVPVRRCDVITNAEATIS